MPVLPKQFIERLLEESGSEEEMLAVLDDLGLSISEVEGMTVMNLDSDDYTDEDDDYDTRETLRLPKPEIETYVQEVNKDQLLKIAKRFTPDTSATTVAPLKKAVEKALKSPKHIKAVIDNLNPLEEELLLEVKRCGGVVNGWGLILHALSLGFEPESMGAKTTLYRVEAADHPGIKFLQPLLRDCLLLPSSTYASWFERYYYGYQQTLDIENDMIQVDERILNALPEKAPPKAIVPKFKVLKDIDASGFVQKHPLEAILKLTEVLKLIEGSGGLQTNKDGSISKNAIKKLIKLAPWLEDELESYLEQIKPLGFLIVTNVDGKMILRIDINRFEHIQNAPIEITYCLLFDGFINSNKAKYSSGSQYGSDEVVHTMVARRALVDAVCQLPDEAVDLDAVLKLLWKQKLSYVMKAKVNRAYYGNSKTIEKRPLPKWFRHCILEELHTYGLVAIKETSQKEEEQELNVRRNYYSDHYIALDKTNFAIKVTPAKAWWHKGRALNKALHLSPPKDETAYKKIVKEVLGKDYFDTASDVNPAQKSLLIQANFDILVYLDMLTPEAITALNCADCTRIDAQTANYTISRSSIYRALEMGQSLEGILQLLKDNSHDLPNNVKVSITEWASRRERLSVSENTTLLEFPTSKVRDAALKTLSNSRAIAERFLLVSQVSPKVSQGRKADEIITTVHNYRAEPKRIIEFKDDGSFTLKGASDLAGRAVLAALAKQDTKGNYSLDTKAIQSGAFTKVAKESLLKRTKGGLPAQLAVLIDIWSGKTSSPAIGQVSVFQHASANELAKHPSIAPLLAGQLGATSFLVKEGQSTELNKAIKALGIIPNKTVEQNLEPKVVEKEESMKKGLPTRKMREMIETAISTERNLELKYNEEKHTYDRYGYTRVSKGKSVTEEIIPDSVYYEGSTPYFYGRTVKADKPRNIRIGYITEIQVI